MIHHFKVVGCSVLALIAFGAVSATAAGAAQFTASSYPSTATATSPLGNDDLSTEAGSVECSSHYAVPDISGASESVSVTPSFTSCKAFGFLEATVNMNGCKFIFHADGGFDLACSGANEVVIEALSCQVKVASQKGLVGVGLTNAGSNIHAKAAIGGITYNVTNDGFLCPFAGKGTKEGAAFTQNNAVTFGRLGGGSFNVDP